MNRLYVVVAATFLTFCVLPGCGGSSEPTNVAADSDAAAIAEYEAAVAAESAGMSESDVKEK